MARALKPDLILKSNIEIGVCDTDLSKRHNRLNGEMGTTYKPVEAVDQHRQERVKPMGCG